MRARIPTRLVVALSALCGIVLLNAAVSYYNVMGLVTAEKWVSHTLQVRGTLTALLANVVSAETAQRGFTITGDAAYLSRFERAVDDAHRTHDLARQLTSDNSAQQRRLENLEPRLQEKIDWMRSIIETRRQRGLEPALAEVATGRGVALTEALRAALADMENEENALLALRSNEAARSLRATIIGLVVFTIVAILFALFALYVIRRDFFARQRAAERLSDANQMLQLVLDTVPQRVFWKDRESRFLGCNRLFAQDAGRDDSAEIVGKTDAELGGAKNMDAYRADDKAVLESGVGKLNYEETLTRPDGSTAWIETSKVPLRDFKGNVLGILGTYQDISERKAAERRLRLQANAIESSVNGIFITDATKDDHPIEYVNSAVEVISGYRAEELVGRNCRILQGPERDQTGLAELRLALREGRACNVVLRNYRKDGVFFWNDLKVSPVRNEHGQVTHHVGVLNDITDRIRYQQDLERQANFDSLTGLANRNLVMDRLRGALAHAAPRAESFAVAMIDLDNFKFVNDSLGHEVGDKLLTEIGRRVQWVIGPADTLARYGGDEFVLITGSYNHEEALSSVLQAVLSTVAQPVSLSGHELFITCSIGVSVFPADGTDSTTLLRHADLAMYRAKEAGRNRFELFLPEMTQRVQERLALERGLRLALEEQQFRLHYQPQIDLATGKIVGAEALIRWAHPDGMMSPARFIPVAEDSGLIVPIGEWVLRQACLQCKAWHDLGFARMRISVNLSALQFRQKDFLDLVALVLDQSGLAANFLELEVTESLLMTGADAMLAVLEELKARGIELAIDDFGTGYSSLNYLKRLPIDRLKIDQSFVRGLPGDADDVAITRATISLARAMDLAVIAEGVETREQAEFLAEQGCDEVQGYYFGRPVPAEEFEALMRKTQQIAP